MPLLAGILLAIQLGFAPAAGAQLVNPAFDNGPEGPVGNFGQVVGPPFQDGFWGAESGTILRNAVCGFAARSSPFMLQLAIRSDVQTEAWQAVDVTGAPPAVASLSAWANSCATSTNPVAGVEILTFNNVNGWPNFTARFAASLSLDADPTTWEKVSRECASIPPDTEWILARLFFVNSTMGGSPGYFDDVSLIFAEDCPVPVQSTTWGTVKALFR